MPTISDIKYSWKFDFLNLTYSLTSMNAKWDGSAAGLPDLFNTKNDLNASWKTSFATAIELWDAYSKLNIENITVSGGTDANIYSYRADVSGQSGATAWFDHLSTGTEYIPITDGGYVRSEFVFDNAAIAQYDSTPEVHGYILLHEIGHALGLKGDVAISGDFTTDMSVMSYNITGAGYYVNSNGQVAYTSLSSGRLPVTPMPYDIAALEEKYGSFSHNTEDANNYTFTGLKSSLTIVDTAGDADTLNASTHGAGVILDLRQSLGPNGEWYGDNVHSEVGDQFIYIARGTVIERAIGTSYNDVLQGNDQSNILIGGDGADVIVGNGGEDDIISDIAASGDINAILGGEYSKVTNDGDADVIYYAGGDVQIYYNPTMTALIDTVDMTATSFSAADADVVRVGDSVTVVFDNNNRVTFNGWTGDL